MHMEGDDMRVTDAPVDEVAAEQDFKVVQTARGVSGCGDHRSPKLFVREEVNGPVGRSHRRSFDDEHASLSL